MLDNQENVNTENVEFADPIRSSLYRVGQTSSKLHVERATALNPTKYKKVKSKVSRNVKISDKVEH